MTTISGTALVSAAMASPTQEVTLTAHALAHAVDGIEHEAVVVWLRTPEATQQLAAALEKLLTWESYIGWTNERLAEALCAEMEAQP